MLPVEQFSDTMVLPPTASDENLVIEVINSCDESIYALNTLINRQACRTFGLDCEWNIVHTKGTLSKPDLLQIATTDGYCALFRLNLIKVIPPALKAFLENPEYTKVGVAVLEDTKKLLDSFGVSTQGVLDLRYLADEEGFDPRGLSSLSKTVLGVTCQKQDYNFHLWTGQLTEDHKRYAAADAVYGVRIFAALNHRRILKTWGDEFESWSTDEYNRRSTSLWEKYYHKPFEYYKSKFVIWKTIDDILRLSDLTRSLPAEDLLENTIETITDK